MLGQRVHEILTKFDHRRWGDAGKRLTHVDRLVRVDPQRGPRGVPVHRLEQFQIDSHRDDVPTGSLMVDLKRSVYGAARLVSP